MESFNTAGDPSQESQTNNQISPNNEVSFQVGDRQYSPESAAKKITHADQHIETLTAEKREMEDRLAKLEAQLNQSTKLDDALEKMKSNYSNNESVEPQTQQLDLNSLKGELLSEIEAKQKASEQEKQAEARKQAEAKNFSQVAEQLAAMYGGDQVDAIVSKKAQEFDMGFEDAIALARSQPKLFLGMFGNGKTTTGKPQQGQSLNSVAHGAVNSQQSEQDAKKAMVSDLLWGRSLKKDTVYGLADLVSKSTDKAGLLQRALENNPSLTNL